MRNLIGDVFECGDDDVTIVSAGEYRREPEWTQGHVIVQGNDGHDYVVTDEGHVYVCGSDCTRSVAKLPELWK